jgi:hypothetical protein
MEYGSVKTTLEIPDPLFRKAKATAAENRESLKQFVTEALQEKLGNARVTGKKEPEWMKYFGAFGKAAAQRAENRRIEKLIEDEFERIDSED